MVKRVTTGTDAKKAAEGGGKTRQGESGAVSQDATGNRANGAKRNGRKRRIAEPPREAEEIFFSICDRFLDPKAGRTADEVAAWATEEMTRRGKPLKINRQHIYPIVQKAIRAGHVRFCPPLSYDLSTRIADRSGVPEENITVVDVDDSEHMASVAAEQSYRLIEQVVRRKQAQEDGDVTVHLGLGAGRTTMLVAKHLGRLLRSTDPMPGLKALVVHAISSGYLAGEPITAPGATYFADLREACVKVRFVPLLAEPMVLCSQFAALRKRPGIKEAFEQKDQIDIVITSFAGRDNEFGMFNRLEKDYREAFGKPAKVPHRVGDVQFRPFDENGPVEDPKDGFRAVTLFELDEYREKIEKKEMFLLLVAGPAFRGDSKAEALATLFTVPRLRIWSHACMDIANGRELLRRLKAGTSP